MADDAVTMYDQQGKAVQIPRQQWIEQVLPQSLKAAWNNPEALYAVIVMGLREQQPAAVMEALDQLGQIDANLERVAVTRGIAQIQLGQLDQAEATFNAYLAAHGESGAVLTNLARIHNDRNEPDKAMAVLERALAVDPNLDQGLGWYVGMVRQARGPEAAAASLENLAQDPRSWRAQLWQAREHIAAQRFDAALDIYRKVLAERPVAPDGVVQITGDLGNAGKLAEMVDVVAPYYQLEKHGPYAGMNLLQAMVATNRMIEAARLLPRLQAINNPAFAPYLSDFAKRISQTLAPSSPASSTQARASQSTTTPTQSQNGPAPQPDKVPQQIAAVPLLYPIWLAALNKPDWLIPPIPTGAIKIAFFSLADARQSAEADAQMLDHPAGKLTRSLPMYLAETLRLRGSASTVCILPVIPNVGPVISRTPWPLAHMLATCPPEFQPDIVVCGAITQGSRGTKVELHLFKAADKTAIRTLRIPLNVDFTGSCAKALDDLSAALAPLGLRPGNLPAGWEVTNADAYQFALGNLLLQTFASSQIISPNQVANESQTLDGYFALAEKETSPLPIFLTIAGVIASRRYQSPFAQQFSDKLRVLISNPRNLHPDAQRALPIVYRHLGDTEGFTATADAMQADATPGYAEWLGSLKTPAEGR